MWSLHVQSSLIWPCHLSCRPLGAIIWGQYWADCITVSIHWHLSIFALNMKFHRHFRLLGLQVWAKTLLACSKDTRQTSSQVRYGGLIFFSSFFWLCDSLWVSISFLLVQFGGGDWEGVEIGVADGVVLVLVLKGHVKRIFWLYFFLLFGWFVHD